MVEKNSDGIRKSHFRPVDKQVRDVCLHCSTTSACVDSKVKNTSRTYIHKGTFHDYFDCRQIRDTMAWIVSEPMMIYYLEQFRDAYWPDGQLAGDWSVKTDEERLQIRLAAKQKFLAFTTGLLEHTGNFPHFYTHHLPVLTRFARVVKVIYHFRFFCGKSVGIKSVLRFFAEGLKGLVGEHNAHRGSIKFFEAMQDIRLNKHLFYVRTVRGTRTMLTVPNESLSLSFGVLNGIDLLKETTNNATVFNWVVLSHFTICSLQELLEVFLFELFPELGEHRQQWRSDGEEEAKTDSAVLQQTLASSNMIPGF